MENCLHENLKYLRNKTGLTQEALAKELLITRKALGAYEEGRSYPPPPVLVRIADFFSFPDIYLLLTKDLKKVPQNSFKGLSPKTKIKLKRLKDLINSLEY